MLLRFGRLDAAPPNLPCLIRQRLYFESVPVGFCVWVSLPLIPKVHKGRKFIMSLLLPQHIEQSMGCDTQFKNVCYVSKWNVHLKSQRAYYIHDTIQEVYKCILS